MLKSVRIDLDDVADKIEHLESSLDRLIRAEKVDVCARLRGVAKACERIDKLIKDEIKRWRRGDPGYVRGEVFRAKLSLIPTSRLNLDKLKEEYPEAYHACMTHGDEARVTFEVR